MTPGFLRGEAVTSIIKAVHGGCHETWHLVAAHPPGDPADKLSTELVFAVGWIDPSTGIDERPRVVVTVREVAR